MKSLAPTLHDAHVRKWLRVMRRRASGLAWKWRNIEAVRLAEHEAYARNPIRQIEASRRWRMNNPDKIRSIVRAWRAKNPEKTRSYNRKWRLAHPNYSKDRHKILYAEDPDKARKASAAYRLTHPDKVKEAGRVWRRANPYKVLAACQQRRARKRGNRAVEKIDFTIIHARTAGCCGICQTPVNLTLKYPDPFSRSYDHMMPLIKGGEHSTDNLQLTHLRCNLRKHTKVTFQPEPSTCLPT